MGGPPVPLGMRSPVPARPGLTAAFDEPWPCLWPFHLLTLPRPATHAPTARREKYYAALAVGQWKKSDCSQCANVCGSAGCVKVKIVDSCATCAHGDIDLSTDALEAATGFGECARLASGSGVQRRFGRRRHERRPRARALLAREPACSTTWLAALPSRKPRPKPARSP